MYWVILYREMFTTTQNMEHSQCYYVCVCVLFCRVYGAIAWLHRSSFSVHVALVAQLDQPQFRNMRVIRSNILSSLSKKIVPLITTLARILVRMARQQR